MELINSFLDGNEKSFEILIKKWERPLYTFIYRYTGNREDTLEILQETFTSVYKNLKHLRDKNLFSSWVYKIALNYCRMYSRKGKISDRSDSWEDHANNIEKKAKVYEANRDDLTPYEVMEKKELERVVDIAIDRLPPLQKEIIILKEFSGLKFVEISKILRIPVSTAKSRMYLGLKNLKREIERILKFEGNILNGSLENEEKNS